MDNIDKRLLATLAEDARRPLKSIARDLGVSRELLDYRLKKLKAIRGYGGRVNQSLFKGSYFILIQLHDPNILNFFEGKYPHWIGRASGTFDVLLHISSDNISNLVKELNEEIGDNLKELNVLTVTNEINDSYKSLFTNKTETFTNFKNVRNVKLDDKDEKIIKLLQKNARVSNEKIAKQIGLTSEAIRYRIKQLEENAIINYKLDVDVKALDLQEFVVLFKIRNTNKIKVNKPEIVYASETIGEYNFIAKICSNDFYKIFNEIRKDLEIIDFQVLMIE